jgi:hypothetical protein
MTKSIWKFPVPLAGKVRIEMPKDAKVLFAAVQHGQPQIWAEIDTEAPKETRTFFSFGTGWELPIDKPLGRYVGSFIVDNGAIVQHCYEQ